MRNALAALAIVVAAAACGEDGAKPKPKPRPEPAPTRVDQFGQRAAAERACVEAVQAIAAAVGDGFEPADGEVIRRATCADLYIGSCREAWLAVAGAPGVGIDAVIDRCAAVYCDGVTAPKPAACDRAAMPRDADMLAELDRAVLTQGGTDAMLAAVLAKRGRLFAPITMEVTPARPSGHHPTLEISVTTSELRVKGRTATLAELERLVELTMKIDTETQFVITADADVQHGRLVEIMEVIKARGGTRIALSTK